MLDFDYENILTPREERVYQELLTGKTIKEIAKTLCVSPCTINTHTTNIFQKKQVNSRLKLLTLKIEELKQVA